MTEAMQLLSQPPRRFSPFKGWILSTFVMVVVLTIGTVIPENDFALIVPVSLIMTPFALIFTFPTVLVRGFLDKMGALGFVLAGTAYAMLLGLIPDLDLVDRSHFSGWLLQGVSGGAGGFSWWLLDR